MSFDINMLEQQKQNTCAVWFKLKVFISRQVKLPDNENIVNVLFMHSSNTLNKF